VRSQLRFPVKVEVREDLLINHLVSVNEELGLSVGCAIHSDWVRDSIDYLSHLDVLEPIEFAAPKSTA
jgi:hypothetical protein